MRVFELRFLTAIGVIGLCGFVISRGVDLAAFALARSGLEQTPDRAVRLAPWFNVPGVGAEAMRMALAAGFNPADPEATRKRAEGLARSLSAKPSSAINWLSLAAMRVVTREPPEKILGALLLSYVTGPNEGYVMAQRGVFAVSQWEILPQDFRNRGLNDLAATLMIAADSNDQLREQLRAILRAKPPEVKEEISAVLRHMDGVSPQRLAASGL
jgi:hypothetical protein